MSEASMSTDLVVRIREHEGAYLFPKTADALLKEAADEIEALRRSVDNLMKTVDAKQAKIDALMQEFCPGEMSAEQRQRWEDHQVPVSAAEEAELLSALEKTP